MRHEGVDSCHSSGSQGGHISGRAHAKARYKGLGRDRTFVHFGESLGRGGSVDAMGKLKLCIETLFKNASAAFVMMGSRVRVTQAAPPGLSAVNNDLELRYAPGLRRFLRAVAKVTSSGRNGSVPATSSSAVNFTFRYSGRRGFPPEPIKVIEIGFRTFEDGLCAAERASGLHHIGHEAHLR